MYRTVPIHRRQAVCGAVWACLVIGGARAADLSPEERLQAVRQELVQAALQGATQVQSTAWIDSHGALRESSSFRHGMKVRGVRVLSYQRSAAGEPRAQLQWEGREDTVKAAAAAAPAAAACAGAGQLRHVLGWTVTNQGSWSADGIHLVQDASRSLAQAWQQAAGSSTAWRLGDAVADVPVPAPGAPGTYLHLLTARPAQLQAGWLAHWRLEELPLAPGQTEARGQARVRLSLSVQGSDAAAPLLSASADLTLGAQPSAWGVPRLSAQGVAGVQNLVLRWSHSLNELLACQPVKVQVLQVRDGRLQVDQGALAGLRPGDEWLVSDRQQVPRHMLEPEAAQALVLARIERVDAQRAELKVLAGPADRVRPQWQAWPMQHP
jgi:hypothetical protein